MVARFAGARSLDDRRRRRIVTGTEIGPQPTDPVAESPSGDDREVSTWSSVPADHLPLRKLISPKLWKHALIGMGGLAIGGCLLLSATVDGFPLSFYGPGLPRVVSATAARAVSCFAGTLLFLAGELSLLCWWARSRSAEDFSGRYRVWMPAAATLFVWAGCAVTGAHRLLGMISAHVLHIGTEHGVLLCWLLPTLVWSVVIFRPLCADMRGCRLSSTMLWIAGLGWLTAAGLLLGFAFPMAEAGRELVQNGAVLLGAWFLFMGMLLHVRYVLYVTSEPPPARPSRWSVLTSRVRRSAVVVSKPTGQTEQQDRDDKPRAEEHSEPPSATTEKRATAFSPDVSNHAAVAGKPAKPTAAPNGMDHAHLPEMRIDGPPTPDQLRGLSKRQRRQLRKQWRDAQRASDKPIAP